MKKLGSALFSYPISSIISSLDLLAYLLGFIGILNIAGGFSICWSFRNLVLEPLHFRPSISNIPGAVFVPSLFLVMLLVAITRPALSLICPEPGIYVILCSIPGFAYVPVRFCQQPREPLSGHAGQRTVIGYVYCVLGNALLPEQGQDTKALRSFCWRFSFTPPLPIIVGQYTYISAHNDYGGSGLKYRAFAAW